MSDVNFTVSVNSAGATQQLDAIAAGTDKVGQSANTAKTLVANLGAAIAGAFTVNELVDAAAKMESIRAGLLAVSGDATAAADAMEFIRTTANKTGADVTQVGEAFLGLSAATKGTAVEGEPTRLAFEAVATAMGKAGKSAAETDNALVALAQIASKGTVSMEELRGQLGEALPGALQATADGLGVTTKDLIALVEKGQVAADDLFPALTKGLNELYGASTGQSQTLAQEIGNIRNAFVDLADNIAQNGGLDALKTGAEIAQTAIVLLDDALISTGKTIGAIAGAITTLDFSLLPQAFADIEKESRDKLLKAAEHNQTLATYIASVGNEATKAALAQQQQAAASAESGTAAQNADLSNLTTGYGGVAAGASEAATAQKSQAGATGESATAAGSADLSKLPAAYSDIATNAAGAATAQRDQATATGEANTAAGTTATTLIGVVTEYGKVTAALQDQIDTAKEVVNTRAAEGKASVEIAQLLGGENTVRQAQAAALAATSEAVTEEATKRTALVAALEAQRAAMVEVATNAGTIESESTRKRLEELTKLIEARQADADKAQAQAAAALVAAAAAETEAQKLKDNSAEVGNLRAALEALKPKMDEINAARAAGTPLTAEQTRLEIEAAQKTALLKDAIADKTAAIEAGKAVADSDLSLKNTTIDRLIAQQQAIAEVASALGNEQAASQANQQIKELEIEKIKNAAESKREEARIQLELNEAKRKELQESGGYTEAKRLELEASDNKARQLQVEADIADTTAQKLQAIADINNASIGPSYVAIGGIKDQTAALQDLKTASEDAAEAERKRLNVDNEGFTLDKSGKRLVAGNDFGTQQGIINFLKQAGLTDKEALDVSREFTDASGNVPYVNNPGQLRYAGAGGSMSVALQKAAQKITTNPSRQVNKSTSGTSKDLQRRLDTDNSSMLATFMSQLASIQAPYNIAKQTQDRGFSLNYGQADTIQKYQDLQKLITDARRDLEKKNQNELQQKLNKDNSSLVKFYESEVDRLKRPYDTAKSADSSGKANAQQIKTILEYENATKLLADAKSDLQSLANRPQAQAQSQAQNTQTKSQLLSQINAAGIRTGSTVNITINGVRKAVNVSSQQDASTLAAIIQQLTQASYRT